MLGNFEVLAYILDDALQSHAAKTHIVFASLYYRLHEPLITDDAAFRAARMKLRPMTFSNAVGHEARITSARHANARVELRQHPVGREKAKRALSQVAEMCAMRVESRISHYFCADRIEMNVAH